MITPKLKAIDSTQVDVENYVPANEAFRVVLDLSIGGQDNSASDLFYLTVCSPKWLEKYVAENGPCFGHGFLIVDSFNISVIRSRIEKLLSTISGHDWLEVAHILSKFMRWEFESYRQSDGTAPFQGAKGGA